LGLYTLINYKLSSDWMRNVAQYCVKLQKDIAEKLHWLSAAGRSLRTEKTLINKASHFA